MKPRLPGAAYVAGFWSCALVGVVEVVALVRHTDPEAGFMAAIATLSATYWALRWWEVTRR